MPDITCRTWQLNDLPNLLSYLQHLDAVTRSRFEPHPFTLNTLTALYYDEAYTGFILMENKSTYIIGYAIIKLGYFEHDLTRLNSYSFFPDHYATAMYAPSLANEWRGRGMGKMVWEYVEDYLLHKQVKHVLLWGGVQETNSEAVLYYQKLGFQTLGRFEMNGMWNMDMVKYL